jgi:hypothetical protein
MAQAVHESIRAYQSALGESVAPPWDNAGELQDWSREAVEFALTNPTPGAQHEAWITGKVRDGWTFGPTKDGVKKTHPSLRPFEQLPQSEKTKDAILIAVVRALAPLLGIA